MGQMEMINLNKNQNMNLNTAQNIPMQIHPQAQQMNQVQMRHQQAPAHPIQVHHSNNPNLYTYQGMNMPPPIQPQQTRFDDLDKFIMHHQQMQQHHNQRTAQMHPIPHQHPPPQQFIIHQVNHPVQQIPQQMHHTHNTHPTPEQFIMQNQHQYYHGPPIQQIQHQHLMQQPPPPSPPQYQHQYNPQIHTAQGIEKFDIFEQQLSNLMGQDVRHNSNRRLDSVNSVNLDQIENDAFKNN